MLSWYYYQGAAALGRPAWLEPDPTRPDPIPIGQKKRRPEGRPKFGVKREKSFPDV